MKRQTKNDFNGMDSTIQPKPRKRKQFKNLDNKISVGEMINVYVRLHGDSSSKFFNEPVFIYEVVGYKYKRTNGRLIYILQPSVFNDKGWMKEVEDSIKLYIWDEEKQKRTKRIDYKPKDNSDKEGA